MDKWISIAAVTMATTVAACTASQDGVKVQPVLSFDGKPVKDGGTAEYQKGKELLSQGRVALAAQAFQAALFAEGSSVEVLNALAVSYDKLGRYDLSDHYYQRALMLAPNSPQTVNNLAVSLAQRGAPDLAAKLLADAHAQRPSDKTIADNLKISQKGATVEPAVAAVAPLPAPIAPPVPRIEQTSPSTQQLVTFGAAAAPHQPTSTPATAEALPAKEKVDETQRLNLGASTSPAPTVSAPPATAQKVATVPPLHGNFTRPGPATQQPVSTDAVRPDSSLRPAVTPLVVSDTVDAAPTMADETLTVSTPAIRPTVTSEVLAPPAIVGKGGLPEAQKIAAVPPLQFANVPPIGHKTTAVPPQLASKTPAIQGMPPATESPVLALARSRLGSRISESDNIQPPDIAAQTSGAPELALARLGARVEVANGAGHRYMAARMRIFLDGRGFDVAHIRNARSFDHVQTVISYRDQYRREALELANSLAVKVELIRVADLPAGIRLILGSDLLPFDRTLEHGG